MHCKEAEGIGLKVEVLGSNHCEAVYRYYQVIQMVKGMSQRDNKTYE